MATNPEPQCWGDNRERWGLWWTENSSSYKRQSFSQPRSIEVMYKCGHSVDRSSHFLMEARNLHVCVKCPDFQMLAPFPILNVGPTKQNASWLPACSLCVASDVTAVPLAGTWKSAVEARMEGKAQRRKGNMGWPSGAQPCKPSTASPSTASDTEAFPPFPLKSTAFPTVGWRVPNTECERCTRRHERGDLPWTLLTWNKR